MKNLLTACFMLLAITVFHNAAFAWPPMILTFSVTANTKCAPPCNGAINLTVTQGHPPYLYTWSNGATTQDISALCTGNYSVTVKDQDNTYKYLTVTVGGTTNTLSLNLTATPNSNCGSGICNGIITPTVTGGTAPYTYQWSTGGITTGTKQIATGNDDSEEHLSDGSILINGTHIDLGYESTNQQIVGLRFTGIAIPAGATITSAKLQFVAWSDQSSTANFVIKGEKAVNSAAFTTAAFNISGRVKTTALVNWNSVPAWTTGTTYTSPDFINVINEIRTNGWVSGNALTLLITGTGQRSAESFENYASKSAKLVITYTTGTSGTSLNNLCAGTYSVTVTDANGCTKIKSVIIDCVPGCTLNVNAGNDITCFSSSTTLTATSTGASNCSIPGVTDCNHVLAASGGYLTELPTASVCGDEAGAKLWTKSGQGISFITLDFGATVPAGTQVCVRLKLEHCSNSNTSYSNALIQASTAVNSGFTNLASSVTFTHTTFQEYCYTLAAPARYIKVTDNGNCAFRVDYVKYVTVGTNGNTVNYSWSGPGIVGATNTPAITINLPGSYRVTATDCKGCIDSDTVVVVCSNVPPTITGVGGNNTIYCPAQPQFSNPTASGPCGSATLTFADVTTPGACPQAYSKRRTWTATDICGNTATASQTITVIDNTPPTITGVGANNTINCPAQPQFSNPTATDNCGTATLTFVDVTTPGACPQAYSKRRTWTATDLCGNTSTASQTITVIDNTAPTITGVGADNTINCPAQPQFSNPTATDLCGSATLTFADVTTPGACPQAYSKRRTWTATDLCGNTSTASQTITVIDNTPPTITGVGDDATIECPATPEFSEPTVSDLCDANPSLDFEDATTPGDCPQEYSTTRTWTATDACGNTATASQTISVIDTTAPVALFTANDTTISCTAAEPPVTAVFEDACDDDVDVSAISGIALLDCGYQIQRSWTAEDDCGNITTVNQTITVIDDNDPVIEGVGVDAIIECPETPEFSEPTVSDLCDESPSLDFEDVTTPGDCPQEYSIARTWTATDTCGNTSTASQTITVIDNTPPFFTTELSDKQILCTEPIEFDTPEAEDACGSVDLSFADDTVSVNCPEEYVYTRTWTATDACGNTSSTTLSQSITVLNPHTISGTNPTCEDACSGTATSTGLCYTFLWSNDGETTSSISGLCGGTYTVTLTDAFGCTDVDTVTIDTQGGLTVEASGTNPTGCGECDGTATVDVIGGTPPFHFEWSTGDTTQTIGTGSVQTGTTELYINSGGPKVTSDDSTFSCETGGGCTPYYNSLTAVFTNVVPIAGPTNDSLYWNERNTGSNNVGDTLIYRIPVTNGQYDVSLYFAELFFGVGSNAGGVGSRKFDVKVGGTLWLNDFDIFAIAGPATALIKDTTVTITDGFVTIEFINVVNRGKVNAISVKPHPAQSGGAGLCAGTYTVTVTDSNGCVGTDTVVLEGTDTSTITNVDITICDGDSVFVGGDFQTEEGTYTDTLVSTGGCDSIIITELIVLENITVFADTTICFGDSIFLGGAFQKASIVITETFTAANGCDSTRITSLTVNPEIVIEFEKTDVSCDCQGSNNDCVLIYDNLEHGEFISNQFAAQGIHISGDANNHSGSLDTVIVFNSDLSGTQDPDLQVGLGNLLILPEYITDLNNDGIVDDPDDWQQGGKQIFTFDSPHHIESFIFVDNDQPVTGLATAYDEFDNEIGSVAIPITPNGQFVNVNVNMSGVRKFVVEYNGSGAALGKMIFCQPDTCCDGTAEALVSGGTPPFTYSWDNGENTSSLDGLCPGTYVVTITDSIGCTAQDTVEIGLDDCDEECDIDVTIEKTDVSCDCQPGTVGNQLCLLDFAGLEHGRILNGQYAAFGVHFSANANGDGEDTLIIFNSNLNGTPDPDLEVNIGNLAIIPENLTGGGDGIVDSPNDNNNGGEMIFTFDQDMTVQSFVIVDVDHLDGDPRAKAYNQFNVLLLDVAIPILGEASVQTVNMNISGVRKLVINTSNSIGVTDLRFECDTVCCDGTAEASVLDGTSPFTYLWSTGDETSGIDSLCPGLYCVTVTDADGCVTTECVTVGTEQGCVEIDPCADLNCDDSDPCTIDVCDPEFGCQNVPTGGGSPAYLRVVNTYNNSFRKLKFGSNPNSLFTPAVNVTDGGNNTSICIILRDPNQNISWNKIRINAFGSSTNLINYIPVGGVGTNWTQVCIPISALSANPGNISMIEFPASSGHNPYELHIQKVEFVGGPNPYLWFGEPKTDNKHDGQSGTGSALFAELIPGEPCGAGRAAPKRSADEDGDSQLKVAVSEMMLKAYPNPFSDQVTIEFSLPETERIKLEITSIDGRRLATLFEGEASENENYKVDFHSGNLANGMYFYRMITEAGEVHVGKLSLVR